jgi:hypothetical protein
MAVNKDIILNSIRKQLALNSGQLQVVNRGGNWQFANGAGNPISATNDATIMDYLKHLLATWQVCNRRPIILQKACLAGKAYQMN